MKYQIQKRITKTLTILFIFVLFFAPLISFAGLVPCGTGKVVDGKITDECTFDDIIVFVKNIIGFITTIATSIAVIMFIYAGFLYMTAGGSPGKIETATKIFTNVLYGYVFILVAWLIINTIASVLLDEAFFKNSFGLFFEKLK